MKIRTLALMTTALIGGTVSLRIGMEMLPSNLTPAWLLTNLWFWIAVPIILVYAKRKQDESS